MSTSICMGEFGFENHGKEKRHKFPREEPRLYTMRRFLPPTESNHFEFEMICHKADHGYVNLGVVGKNHVLSKSSDNVWFGKHGGIGWGWARNRRAIYYTGGLYKDVARITYKDGDRAGMEINKLSKKLIIKVNGKYAGEMDGVEFPRELYLAMCHFGECDVELVSFTDHQKCIDIDEPERVEYLIHNYCDSFDIISRTSQFKFNKIFLSL